MKSMEENDEDTPAVKEIKHAIRENLKNWYTDLELQDFFHKCVGSEDKDTPTLGTCQSSKKNL